MLIEKVKTILKSTGDLRKLTKENGEVRITDLFLNDDGKVMMEQYSTINKTELTRHLQDGNITPQSVADLLEEIKLWVLFTEEDSNGVFENATSFFGNVNPETTSIPKDDLNSAVISFMDSDEEEYLFTY